MSNCPVKRASGVPIQSAFFLALIAVWGIAEGRSQRLTPAQIPIPSTFFGMHIHHLISGNEPNPPTPWPQVTVPAWRLWDVRVTWTDLEPAKGQWKFDVLDKVLELAREHDTQVQLTFGFTPAWASTRPTEASLYRPGGAAEPRSLDDWTSFVRTVAIRYQGRIHTYEIWNEPNVPRYWSGSPEQMVELARLAHDAIKGIDPSAIIVAPSPVGEAGLVWLSSFLNAGGAHYVDVIGFHFYVFPAPPEAMVALINSVKAIMRGYGISDKPLWDTEAGWSKPSPFPSDEMAAGYLARAFVLNWASGVQRFYWYAWDNHGWAALRTTEPDNRTLTPAGTTYGIIQKWLTGTVVNWCEQDANQNWTCQLKDHAKDEWIVWNPNQSSCMVVPSRWSVKHVTPLLSSTHAAGDGCVEVGPTPALLTP
jgi:Glycosyl hydrolases family 39